MSVQTISQQIRRLQLQTRKILSGTMVGDRSSATKGAGFEFDQVREYQQGDDVRFIDWKATARAGKFLTKQYIEERNHRLMLALDVSLSSFVGGGSHGKFSFMAELAAVFALVAEYGKDQAGLTLFSDQINLHTAISGAHLHYRNLLQKIFEFKPDFETKSQKNTDFNLLFNHLMHNLPGKSLIIIISDLIGLQRSTPVLRLLATKHEVVFIRCLDQFEQTLRPVGLLPVIDPETGQTTTLDLRSANHLNQILNDHFMQQQALIRRSGADLLCINDQQRMVAEVVRFFRRRLTY